MTPDRRRSSPGSERPRRDSFESLARRDSLDGSIRQSLSRSGTPRRASIDRKPAPPKGDRTVEVWENERWSRKRRGWVPSRETVRVHWSDKEGEPRRPPEEVEAPPDYGWISNWRVDKDEDGNGQDKEGWEYSTSFDKLGSFRRPRGEQRWSDRARRRKWVRVMRPKVLLGDARAATELREQVQQGLQGMVRGRLMLQNLVDMIGTRRDSPRMRDEMLAVIDMVRQHGFEVEELLESIDRDVLPEAKKLANDLYKEHRALEDLANKALEKNRTIPPRNPGPSSSSSTGRRSRASSSSSPSPATADAAGGGSLAPSDTSSNSISNSTGAASQLPPLAPQPSAETAGGVRTVRASSGRTSFRPSRGGAEGGLAVSLQVAMGEDGTYIAREAQEEYIYSQMKLVDGDVFMEQVIREREEAILEINKGVTELKAIFLDFAQLVRDQQAGIDEIEKNIDAAHARVEAGMKDIMYADKMHRETMCILS